ncbi:MULTISPECIES: hypothetical protein [unclassified Mycolicibacterium]|uniref:hypothetical protein n=1 Tax=unclassified Mycolicibacterium TaxID=2636767 RepID=UPI002ED9E83E
MTGPASESDASGFDTSGFDIASDHYRVLCTDPAARAAMIADPKRGLRDHFGYVADGDYGIEIIDENAGVITILLPAPPEHADDIDARLAELSGRSFDVLFSEAGLGGYLIPSTDLTWVLHDMRARWNEGQHGEHGSTGP